MKYGTLFKANTVIVCASSGQSTIMHVQCSRLNLLSRCIITYLAWFFPVYILMANNGSDPGKLLSMHLTLSRWSDPWNLLFFAGLCSKQTNTPLFAAPSLLSPDMLLLCPACVLPFIPSRRGFSLSQGPGHEDLSSLEVAFLDQADSSKHPPPHLLCSSAL